MKRVLGFLLLFLSFHVLSQNPAIDHLEMLYDQGYYKLVYRKSARLLDKPEYDFTKLPRYYRSIASLQLAQDEHWYKRHLSETDQAKDFLLQLRKSEKGQKIILAHISELSFLKKGFGGMVYGGKTKSCLQFKRMEEFFK